MRLRHIPGSEQQVRQSPYVIQDPKRYKGCWSQLSGMRPLEIEIGMGKGKFIMAQAQAHPDVFFVGIERYATVLLKAIKKREALELDNVCFLCEDARELAEIFAPEEVSRIFLNFSDPWPKDRHARRRLTSGDFLQVYSKILGMDGALEFKTDNRGLFEYSLQSVPQAGWEVRSSTYDLHHDPVMAEGNIQTEYEERFSAAGNPICKLIAFQGPKAPGGDA